jgi:hypothetical protein
LPRILVIAALAAAALTAALPPASARPLDTCSQPDTSLHWEAVFGHVASVSEAIVLKRRINKTGFKNVQFERDYCDDVEVIIVGLDTPKMRKEFAKEAGGYPVTYEPPDILKRPHPGFVKAVFGLEQTLKRAEALRTRMAQANFREGTDIEKLSQRSWRVVLYNIPRKVSASFAAEARHAGFPGISFLKM